MVGALALWEAESFSRYNDHELSCTVRLFACCRMVLTTEKGKYAQVSISYDAAQPSPEMLAGTADPTRSPRPDLTLRVGATHIRLEAKLLGGSRKLARLYVSKGMARFLDGRYGEVGVPGVMIGYLLAGEPSTVVDWVNSALGTELNRLPIELLVPQESQHPKLLVHYSHHDPAIRLIHHMVDLRRGS